MSEDNVCECINTKNVITKENFIFLNQLVDECIYVSLWKVTVVKVDFKAIRCRRLFTVNRVRQKVTLFFV